MRVSAAKAAECAVVPRVPPAGRALPPAECLARAASAPALGGVLAVVLSQSCVQLPLYPQNCARLAGRPVRPEAFYRAVLH